MTAPVLVFGATGAQGGAVTDALLARGIRVRAVVRDPRSRRADTLGRLGVELTTGDLGDEDSLTAAMHDVSAVFAVTTPFESGPDAETRQGLTLLRAAERARVPHLVYSSVAGADRDSGVPHFESKAVVEGALQDTDVPFTVLAPTYFFDNLLGGLEEVRAGILELPLPPAYPLQQLSRRDLGEVAAEVLAAPAAFTGRRIELAGDAPSAQEMAATLGAVLRRHVAVREVPLQAVLQVNPDMGAMWAFIARGGYAVEIEQLHRAWPAVRWTTFARWATDAFGSPPTLVSEP